MMNDKNTTDAMDSQRTMPGRMERKSEGRKSVGDVILGRYKILSELGQGGMGVVYKCFDETAGVEVALKALPPELSHNTYEMEDIKENFQLVSKLVHQNIAVYKNLERDAQTGDYYLIMECVDGENLRGWMRRMRKEGELTLEMIQPVIRQVAEALDYAHSEKIIHRDVKPGNVMITAEGKVKVLDFGLAAEIHTSMTRVSMAYHGTSGTGPYMAPEQWRGRRQNAPADQYALAVMVYEMLAGHLPFESPDATILREAVLNDIPEPLESQNIAVQNTVKRAMSKDPQERFGSCVEFVKCCSIAKHKSISRKKTLVKSCEKYSVKQLIIGGVLGGIMGEVLSVLLSEFVWILFPHGIICGLPVAPVEIFAGILLGPIFFARVINRRALPYVFMVFGIAVGAMGGDAFIIIGMITGLLVGLCTVKLFF